MILTPLTPHLAQQSQQNAPLRCLAQAADQIEERVDQRSIKSAHPFTDIIDLHQRFISPADGPRSHFYPVSSTYARLCFQRFGARGILLGFDRLMKENGEMWLYQLIEIDGQWIKCDLPPTKQLHR